MAILFQPNIHGCAETEKGMATRSLTPPTELKITPNANGFFFRHALDHQCCRKAELTYTREGNTLTIIETWSGAGCRCRCFSELEAQVSGLERGGLHIRILERGIAPEKIIHEETIEIGG